MPIYLYHCGIIYYVIMIFFNAENVSFLYFTLTAWLDGVTEDPNKD